MGFIETAIVVEILTMGLLLVCDIVLCSLRDLLLDMIGACLGHGHIARDEVLRCAEIEARVVRSTSFLTHQALGALVRRNGY